MRHSFPIAILIGASYLAQPSAPQVAPEPRNGGAPSKIEAAVEAYRAMWRGMTAGQREKTLRSGGYTPEQYEKMLRGSAGAAARSGKLAGAPDFSHGISEGALDNLGTSLRDLNAIRDANVLRLRSDGCPPEVAQQIADLEARLAADEAEMRNSPQQYAPHRSSGSGPDELAKAWIQPAVPNAALQQPAIDSLDSVLPLKPGNGAAPAAEDAGLATRRENLRQEAGRLRAKIDHLQGGCTTARR